LGRDTAGIAALALSKPTIETGTILEAQGDIEQAIDIFREVVAADPTAEHAHRALMQLYASTGHRHRAMQQYGRLREILERELALEPDPDSQRLYEDILSDRFQTEMTQR